MAISLRPLADGDLDTLFVWESDPRAVELAAFTRADPSDRTAFAPGLGTELVENIYRLEQ